MIVLKGNKMQWSFTPTATQEALKKLLLMPWVETRVGGQGNGEVVCV